MAETGIADVPRIFLSRDDLIRRALFTLGALAVVRALSFIPLPGINPVSFHEMLAFSGGVAAFNPGSVERLSLAGLGLTPYISALLVTYVIMWAFPGIKARAESGPKGLRDVNQIARVIALAFAVIQGYFVAKGLELARSPRGHALVGMDPTMFRVSTMLTLAAAALLIMHIGEQISVRGLGNGIWVIVAAGMIGNAFQDVLTLIDGLRKGSISFQHIVLLALILLALVALIVFVERARRSASLSGGEPGRASGVHHLPVNGAGFLPPYFSTGFLYMPVYILYAVASIDRSFTGVEQLWGKLSALLSPGQPLNIILDVLLVGFFTLFFVAMHGGAQRSADARSGRVRAADALAGAGPPQSSLDAIVLRLTVVAALYLIFVAVVIEAVQRSFALPVPIHAFNVLVTASVIMMVIEQVRAAEDGRPDLRRT